MQAPSHLYVHIPFCLRKCRYCDFFSVPVKSEPVRRYIDCLRRELQARGARGAFQTLYFGGGTPTSLGEKTLGTLLDALQSIIDLPSAEEFTVEANPGTVIPAKLRLLRAAGANRLSIGVQSFQPKLLQTLGRIHSPEEARSAFALARQAGFENVSIDLIFGIPGQSPAEWSADLEEAIDLHVQHLSAYGLTYEEGTPLHGELVSGCIDPVPQELEREMALHAIRRTRQAGLEHYEISNYAGPGFECRHNLAYWANEPYLGIGAAAASYLDGVRWRNIAHVQRYIEQIEATGLAVESSERLDDEPRARETAALALRTRRGIDRAVFRQRTGFDIDSLFRTSVSEFVRGGLLTDDGHRIALTDEGVMLADEVVASVV